MTPSNHTPRPGKADLRPLLAAFIGTLTGAAIAVAVIALAHLG